MSNPGSSPPMTVGQKPRLGADSGLRLETRISRAIRQYRAHRAMARCARLGEGSELRGVPSVQSHGRLEIGARLRLVSEPVVSHLVVERGAVLRLGNDVRIAHGCGIAASSSIEIGDGVVIGAFTLILDTDYHVPGNPSAPPPCTPIRIGQGVHIGQRAVVLRGSVIGDGARIADGSVVSGEIPAGAKVAGVPAREIRTESSIAASRGSVLDRVASVAMRTFRLAQPPTPEQGHGEIAAWDSLGALSFLFALEEEFAIVLDEGAFARASTIRLATEAVERALALRLR
jgi:acetyltransferase-like isoleucine patch superfamily enzyme/acyl carrier protein